MTCCWKTSMDSKGKINYPAKLFTFHLAPLAQQCFLIIQQNMSTYTCNQIFTTGVGCLLQWDCSEWKVSIVKGWTEINRKSQIQVRLSMLSMSSQHLEVRRLDFLKFFSSNCISLMASGKISMLHIWFQVTIVVKGFFFLLVIPQLFRPKTTQITCDYLLTMNSDRSK